MTTQTNWLRPDWIYVVQKKLQHIDLSKFPSYIYLTHDVIAPGKNKYLPQWAVCINVKLEIKDRVTGVRTQLINPEGVYLYNEKNLEQIIYVEIERLLVHELKECFQIREPNEGIVSGQPVIPFDPHNTKRPGIKFSTYDKIDFYRHYPGWLSLTKIRLSKGWQKFKTKMYGPWIELWSNLGNHIMKFAFEPKVLQEGPKTKQEKVSLFYKP